VGSYKEDMRCENLEKTSFNCASFDLIITQDVLEHIMNPCNAFKEIERILKPSGVHVFTIPYCSTQKTIVRAEQGIEGFRYLNKPLFHDNPVDENGSLVVTEWGNDFSTLIYGYSKMETEIYDGYSNEMGLDADFLEVFVSRKN
jgi:SAM-dependent methyltransferase